jgi:hypothetical protein
MRLLKKRGWGLLPYPEGAAQVACSFLFGFFLLQCQPLEASFCVGSRFGSRKSWCVLAYSYINYSAYFFNKLSRKYVVVVFPSSDTYEPAS